MQMKRLLSIVGVLGVCFLTPSCQRDELDTPHLALSVGENLSLEAESAEQVISLETNQKQWTAITDTEWLEALPAANNLLLRVSTNNSLSTRKGTVVVTAGGLTKRLLVEQKGQNDLSITLGLGNNSNINVEKEGGDFRLILVSNSESWTATSDSEWLHTIARPRNGELVLRIDANTTTATRIGKISIEAQGKSQQIEVKQKGLLHYFLPFSLWGANYNKIEKLETARGSKIKTTPNADARPTIPDYTFATLSEVFPLVKYEFVGFGTDNLYATTLVGASLTEVYSEAFYQFLLEEGYRRISPITKTEGQIEYIHDNQKIRLYITRQRVDNQYVAVVYLYPIVEQAEPQQTLPTFTHGNISFGNTRTQVEEWEANNGGQYDDEFGGILGIPFWFAPDPFLGRGYFFEKKKDTDPADFDPPFNQTLQLYQTHKVAFYKYQVLDYPTQEWNDLMTREGYKFWFFEPSKRTYRYYHQEKRIGLAFKSFPFAVHDFLLVNIFPLPATFTVPASTNANIDRSEDLVRQQLASTYFVGL